MSKPLPRRQNLAPLLNPASVAVVGISQLPRFGGHVYQNLRNIGYAGRIYGINPRYTTLFEQPCYPALRDLPEVPACVILALANDRLLPALQEAALAGVQAAIIPASAWSAPVAGQPTLAEQLQQTAAAHKMVVCGPNCMGLIAFANHFCASGYPIDAGLPVGNVTFITHSGTVFDTIWQNNRGVHFNYLISAGNESITTMADYMQHALREPTTRVIGLFLETVRDPVTFRQALDQAAAQDIPVIALKVGRSEQGARLAQAHSGALTGQDAVYDALFAEYGVQRVKTLDEMLDTLELFAAGLRPSTRYIASMHDSGGERGLLVDLADAEGVAFAPITAETTQKLAAVLEPGLLPVNPLDAWGTGNDYDQIYRRALLALDADPNTGLNVWVADLYAAGTVSATYLEVALAVQDQLQKPLVFLSNLSAAVSLPLATRLRAAGIPVLMGVENGVRAIKHLLAYAEFQRQRPVTDPFAHTSPVALVQVEQFRQQLQLANGALDEFASKAILRAYGIATPDEIITTTLSDACAAAQQIGYPVVLKTAAGELHKSDRGGVLLNLMDDAAVQAAYQTLATTFGARVLVQKQVAAGIELILGLVNDGQFGCVLTLGLGGIFVEVFKDARLLLLPTTADKVQAALHSLQSAPLLLGARGRPPINLTAVVDAALRLAALAADLGDWLAAVDVNPLIASPAGALAVDALIIPKTTRGNAA